MEWNLVSCLAVQYKITRQTEERWEGSARLGLGYESAFHLLHSSPHCAHCRSLWCTRATEGHIISQSQQPPDRPGLLLRAPLSVYLHFSVPQPPNLQYEARSLRIVLRTSSDSRGI